MKHLALLRSALPLTLLTLVACAEPIEERPDTEETAIPVEPDGGIGDGAEPLPEILGKDIPRGLHGRWGLVPADCTSTRGDAKGLIDIDAEGIKFYESRAVVDEVEAKEATMIKASFAFSGEGQEWTRDMEWRLSDDGMQLTRSETGDEAIPDPLTYTKCEAEGEAS
ncbi:hypothetical protein [Qipengyuania aquimaris]|uniref:DUF3617 family protein n=1 Tax=Qipengyuania aquimaris TaxID=255984 RepID=A0A9Q3RYR5_9SPHN|nr:hypothetical protein [Qipengyuania aquimaris]MBY6216913.1 hypothetical protein [Qipengyuania aquimaris]